MGMYDDVVKGASANVEIGGYEFFAENINGDETFNRRELIFKPLLNGTVTSKKGKYVQRKFSFTTTLYHPSGRPDTHDKLLSQLMSKPVTVISPSMGGTFTAMVVFKKNIEEGSPNHITLDVDITEIPDSKSNIPGESRLVVPSLKKIDLKKQADNKADKKYNQTLKKCSVPFKKNSKSNCVGVLQDKLILKKYLDKKYRTGKYDKHTISAVKAFQKAYKKTYNLKVTGIVDKKTRDALIKT